MHYPSLHPLGNRSCGQIRDRNYAKVYRTLGLIKPASISGLISRVATYLTPLVQSVISLDLTSLYLMGMHMLPTDLMVLEVVGLQLIPPQIFDLLRGVS